MVAFRCTIIEIALVLLCVFIGVGHGIARAQNNGQTATDAQRRAARRSPVVDVFQRWRNSVVFLTGPRVADGGASIDEFFRPTDNKRPTVGLGSGLVVHRSGYILTNAHAVDRVASHLVTFGNGRHYRAELVAIVRDRDLALLKIEPDHPLQPVQLGRSGDLMIGETVIVIGNPYGLLHTCTSGIVSAIGRRSQPDRLPGVVLTDLIQTDAGLNPGSSGGPWFNILGEMIGVTTAVRPDSERIGFAVPVASIRKALPGMLDVERRYGITTGLKVHPPEPCSVVAVAADSPAAAIGIRQGDRIVQVDTIPITSGADFSLALVGRKPGERLALRLTRDDKLLEMSLTLGQRPKPNGAMLLRRKLGLTAIPLDEAKRRATGLRTRQGVVISDVDEPHYRRYTNRPMPGDVLVKIDDIRPRDLDHVGQLLERLLPRQTVRITLVRLRGTTGQRIDLKVATRP